MTPDDRRTRIAAYLLKIAADLASARAGRVLKQCASARSVPTAYRVLHGRDHKVSTLIDVAESLGCDVEIRITKRA